MMGERIALTELHRVNLRVARVSSARLHPRADKLLLLDIDVGDSSRQIVAGIREWRAPEDLAGKLIVVVENLEPAVLRGEKSDGMLLAALDGEEFALLVPDREVRPGSRVE